MATKDVNTIEQETQQTQQTQEETLSHITPTALPASSDPHRLVEIKLYKDKSKSKVLYVNVNNHNFVIPRGEVVKVPYYVAAVLENSARQDEETARMIESLGAEAEKF